MAPELVTAVETNPAAGVLGRAYVTFLAGNGDYVKGVVGLAKGLKRVRSLYPLVVAVLPDVPEDHRRILEDNSCIVHEIDPVTLPGDLSRLARPYYVINYSKLRIWKFVEYEKMLYLDSDIQVFDNIDHLFDLPNGYFYAVMDCFCEDAEYKKQCPDKIKWPVELGERPPIYFNAGMFVYEPSQATYDDLLNTLCVTPITPFAEQDYLNWYFQKTFKPIPPIYNYLIAMLWRHPEGVGLDQVKVLHYCMAGSKPWKFTGKEEHMDRDDVKMLVKKWWDIYSDVETDEAVDDPNKIKQEALSEAAVVNYITAPSAA